MSKSKTAASKKKSGNNSAKNFTKLPKTRLAADLTKKSSIGELSLLSLIPAFLIPALLTLIAYAFFKVYPFGDGSVLTLDLNGQYVYYFEGLRRIFWGEEGSSIFYNWSRNLSGGFMGVIGYYLASPFTLIVMLLPKSMMPESIMIMQICKVGAAGLTFSIYAQRSKRVPAIPSLLFSTGYAMMAYVAVQLIDPMWIDGPVFLPLIILGIEYLVDDGRKLNYIIPLALMFIANFYIGFMIAIFVAIYYVYYLFFGTDRKFKDIKEYVMVTARIGVSTVVVLMCSAIMILPVYNALKLGKFDFSEANYVWGDHYFKLPELIGTLMPNQYYSVNVETHMNGDGTLKDLYNCYYGRPEIYCGILSIVMLPLFYMNKKIKKNRKIGYSFLLFVMVMSMYIKPINMMWHGGQDPNWLPYRYSFLLSFIIVAMAADCFGNLDGYKLTLKQSAGVFGGIFAAIFIFAELMPTYQYSDSKFYKYVAVFPYVSNYYVKDDVPAKYNGEVFLGSLAVGVLLAAAYTAYAYGYSISKSKSAKNTLTLMTACVVLFEAGYNMYDTFRKVDLEVDYQDRSSYNSVINCEEVVDELENYDNGFYRAEKTSFRMVNDNIAYGIKGLSHSSSVMNTRILNFLGAVGYFTQTFESKYYGGNPVADSLLGIKYVLDGERSAKYDVCDLYEKKFTTTFTDTTKGDVSTKTIDYYQNPYALSIGYAASTDVLNLNHLGNDNPLNSINNYLSALTGNTADYTTDPIIPKQYYYTFSYDEVKYDPTQVKAHDYYDNKKTPNDPSDDIIQYCYESFPTSNDATIDVYITAPKDGDIYMHVGSAIKRTTNVHITTNKNENGELDFKHTSEEDYGQYFETNSAPIINIGHYTAGTQILVRFTIPPTNGSYTGSDEYLMVNKNSDGTLGFNFACLDTEAFKEDIALLQQNQWELDLDKCNDRYLEGTVTIGEGQFLATSIPYEPGWTIEVDGKKVDNLVTEVDVDKGVPPLENEDGAEGQVVILNAMIGVKLPAGTHTVSMKYTPPGFTFGVVTLILGIGVLVVFYLYDRKNNKVILERINARKKKKNGDDGKSEDDSNEGAASENSDSENSAAPKKKVQIIKSKAKDTAKAKPAETDAQRAARERAEAETERINKKNQELISSGEKFIEQLDSQQDDSE